MRTLKTPKSLVPIAVKIERANETIDHLESEIVRFLETSRYEIVGHFENNSCEYVLSIKGPGGVPHYISVLAGEVIHHLRSSLDHLVTALVVANAGTPGRHHFFPIKKDRQAFHRACESGCIKGVSARAADLIEKAQPYHNASANDHVLAGLDDADNVDKHRLLLLVSAAASLGDVVQLDVNLELARTLGMSEPFPAITNMVFGNPNRRVISEKGAEYFRFVFDGPFPCFDGKAEAVRQITFEKFGDAELIPVTNALRGSLQHVKWQIAEFFGEF